MVRSIVVRSSLAICALLLGGASSTAHAEPRVLRLATPAPDGTAWARELNTFAREVEAGTGKQLRIKWYFGGIAGDEVEMAERVRRGQLDGVASGGPMCERLAPSLRVLRVLGVATGHAEAAHVIGSLRATLDDELGKHGFVYLAVSPLGPHILFSRTAIRSLSDLRHGFFWVWDQDDVLLTELKEFGVNVVPLTLDKAGRAYENGQIDGFVAPASVALAFQWSAQARFVTDLRMDMISGCVLIANRAFDSLPVDARSVMRAAAAKLQARFEDLGVTQDKQLLGGLFAKQGVKTVEVSETFASEFFAEARAVRDRLGAKLIAPEILAHALGLLADYRATNR